MTYVYPTPAQIQHDTAEPKVRARSEKSGRTRLDIAVSDFIVIVSAGFVSSLHFGAIGASISHIIYAPIALASLFGLLFLGATQLRSGYHRHSTSPFSQEFLNITGTWSLLCLLSWLVIYVSGHGGSYAFNALFMFAVTGLGLLGTSRALWRLHRDRGFDIGAMSGRRALVIGGYEELSTTSAGDLLQMYSGREIGRFVLPSRRHQVDQSSDDQDLSIIDEAISFARQSMAEVVFLALGRTNMRRLEVVRARLQMLPLSVFLLPDHSVRSTELATKQDSNGKIVIELQRAPLTRAELATKRAFDIILGAIAVLMLLPLFAMVSLAIKLSSPGPVIFRQHRHGFNRRKFAIYKFRTMNVQENGGEIKQASRIDARVTSLGRFLRSTSIDELPQLFNVLRGDMSLVGPRPHACAHDDKYAQLISNYAFRHHIKPGITGWAQVNGLRGETPRLDLMKRRIDSDLWYINNWSTILDFKIIARTFVELIQRTAY
jgi:Undecaprenyl-phosphate glucose phosphotransferase